MKKIEILGTTSVLIGVLLFTLCNAFVKKVGGTIPISMIVFIQSVICILYCLPWIYQVRLAGIKTTVPRLLIIRGIAEVIGIYTLFWSFQFIPLIDGLLLNNAAPLWVPLFLFVLYGIKIRSNLWWGLLIGFIGVIFILRPDAEIFQWGALLALISGFVTAYVMITIAELSKTEPSNRIIFYCFITCLVIITPVAVMQWKMPTLLDWIYMILSGLSLLTAMIFFNYGFKHGKIVILSSLLYLSVVFGGILDWLIWHDIPTLFTILGCLFVIVGGIVTIIIEHQPKKLKSNNTIGY